MFKADVLMRSVVIFWTFSLIQAPVLAEENEAKPSYNLLYLLGPTDDSAEGYLLAMKACDYIWKRSEHELQRELFMELSKELEAFSAKMPKSDKELEDTLKRSLENMLKGVSDEADLDLEGGFPKMSQRLSQLIDLIIPYVKEAEEKFEISFEF